MQALSQSAFLQALGYAIASSLWQAALLWLLVAGCNGLFKLTSQVKYKVAVVAQFSAFVWFLVTLQFYYNKCSEAIAQMRFSGLNSGNAFVLQTGDSSFSSVMLSAVLKGEKLLPYLSIAYLCLLVLLAARWIKGYRQTMVIKTLGQQKIDIQWRLFVKRISELLNIKHKVNIYVSELVKSPLTIGFLKPIILIPLASINNLTTYQLEAVLLHELAHIKRADYIINIIQSIIETALFFNPFTQLLGKIIKRERENSCDDWVLQFQYDASTYAEALLRIAYLQQAPAFAMNAAGHEKDLLWRVKRMLNQKEKTFQYRNRLFALLLITGLLSSVAWFNPTVKTETAKQDAKTQAVVEEPLAAKVNNPLFNPMFFLNKPIKEEVDKATEDAGMNLQAAGYGLNAAKNILAKVAPAVADKIQTINIDLPAVMSQAGDAVNTAFKNLDASGELPKELKAYTDSNVVLNIINNASGALRNIDWKKMNNGIAQAEKELNVQLADKNLFAGVGGSYLKELIKKSLATAQQSLTLAQQTPGENGDDDASPVLIAPGGSKMKSGQSTRTIKIQKAEQKIFELKKTVDSLRSAYIRKGVNYLSSTEPGDLYSNLAVQFNQPPAYQTPVYSYSAPQAVVNTYLPAKYDLDAPSVTVGKGNELSVTTKGNSTLIAVKEDEGNTDSYKKRITIETLDTTGQKHIFHITVEVYQ